MWGSNFLGRPPAGTSHTRRSLTHDSHTPQSHTTVAHTTVIHTAATHNRQSHTRQSHTLRMSRKLSMFWLLLWGTAEVFDWSVFGQICRKNEGTLSLKRVFLEKYGHGQRNSRGIRRFSAAKCARLEPQPLRKGRNAPDSSHSHFAKTEMRPTVSSLQLLASLEMQQATFQVTMIQRHR